MPRRLIIGILIVLILGVIGGTVYLLVRQLTNTGGTPGSSGSIAQLELSEVGPQAVENPTGDDDADGLTNAEEVLWGTVPTNADTDGDGTPDGEEVAANRNPTIAGPNDQLPAGFQPQQNLQPLSEAPLKTDEFFQDNLDLSGGSANLTETYQQRVNASERNADTLAQFVQQQPIITKLPTVRDSALTIERSAGSLSLSSYLAVAGNTAALSNQDQLTHSLAALYDSNDPSGIISMQQNVTAYQAVLQELSVPAAAVELHKLLLGYTELVEATFGIIAGWPDDPVKAVLALRQLDVNDQQYFPLIQQEIARLQSQTAP